MFSQAFLRARCSISMLAFVVWSVSAGAQAQLTLNWATVDAGGGKSSSSALTISGTAGQPDTTVSRSPGSISLAGGYWPSHGIDAIFQDRFEVAQNVIGGRWLPSKRWLALFCTLDGTGLVRTPVYPDYFEHPGWAG